MIEASRISRMSALALPILIVLCAGQARAQAAHVQAIDTSATAAPAPAPQDFVELELEPLEVARFRAFMATLGDNERRSLLAVISRMPEGMGGLFVAREVLPNPVFGARFAHFASIMNESEQARFAAELGRNFENRWPAISEVLASATDRDLLVRAIQQNMRASDCNVDEQEQGPPGNPPQSTNFGATDVQCDADLLAFLAQWHTTRLRMIRSVEAPARSVPWQAQLMRAGEDSRKYRARIQARYELGEFGRQLADWERDHLCGAAYIGGTYVLTAAHCVEGWTGYDAEFFDGRRIRAGTQDLAAEGEVIPIRSVVIHASYKDSKAYLGSDIALIVLARKPQGADVVRILIPRQSRNGLPVGTRLSLTGWGLTGATANSQKDRDRSGKLQQSSRFLRMGALTLFDNARCNNDPAFQDRGVRVRPGQLCVGSDEGVDACRGDSGGPLVRKTDGRSPVLVGLVSWGIGCGIEDRPGIYTDVGAFHDWIKRAQANAQTGRITKLQ